MFSGFVINIMEKLPFTIRHAIWKVFVFYFSYYLIFDLFLFSYSCGKVIISFSVVESRNSMFLLENIIV